MSLCFGYRTYPTRREIRELKEEIAKIELKLKYLKIKDEKS